MLLFSLKLFADHFINITSIQLHFIKFRDNVMVFE